MDFPAMTAEYKAEKLASVSHLSGGGLWEINHVTVVAPAAAFLWAVLQSRQRFFKPYTLAACLCDFLLHCGAILFAITVYAGAPQVLTGLLALPAVAAYLQPSVKTDSEVKLSTKKTDSANPSEAEKDPLPAKPFITTYRGAMMIITCISILAVDFPVFPRRFAKTESFGKSLMDLGVGSFVFAGGIVAARQSLKEEHSPPSFLARMKAAIRHSLPLLILGLARLYSVKKLEYVEHVSEYGVHWNFFFTLALLPPVTALLQPILRVVPSHGILAFIIACCYETALYYTRGLKVYIILSERIEGDWLSQNREGVFSFIGYFAIFIAGMGVGRGILPRDPPPAEPRKPAAKDSLDEDEEWLAAVLSGSGETQQAPAPSLTQKVQEMPQLKPEIPKTMLAYLLKWTGLWCLFTVFALWRYGPRVFVSRRMANMGYVVWVCAFNTAQLLLFYLVELGHFPDLYDAKTKQIENQRIKDATSRVMKAFNRNGLALFLIANLLTGLINMTIPTLHMSDVQSMVILLSYIAVICSIGLALDHFNISIKL